MFSALCWRKHEIHHNVALLFVCFLFFVAVAEENVVSTLTPQSQTGGLANDTILWAIIATAILVLLIGAFTAIVVRKKRQRTRKRAVRRKSSAASEGSVYSVASDYGVGSAKSAGSEYGVGSAKSAGSYYSMGSEYSDGSTYI